MPDPTARPPAELADLVALVARLRAPDGCPWDREQGLANLRAYLVEEAHELAAAIDGGDWEEIAEELGDLLFQAAFVARLGEEAGALSAAAVVAAVHAKLVARHPHVFGGEQLADAGEVVRAWERRKAAERPAGLLAGVPPSLPALLAAYRMTQKAAGVGFDWPDAAGVLAKLREELGELEAELAAGAPAARVGEELGDLLFAAANLARHLGHDPECALAGANAKFRRRFAAVEAALAGRGIAAADAGLELMDALWEEAKRAERADREGRQGRESES